MKKKWIGLLAFVGALLGQHSPVEVKRIPPSAEGVPAPEKYPFGQLIQTLEADAPLPVTPQRPMVSVDLPAEKEAPLPPNAREALAVGREWMSESHTPATGKDGRVVYTYGAGLPALVCAPLRICILELEAGERLVGEPHIGDSVRWVLSPASSGQAGSATPMIVLKPKQAGLDTNLLVTTDRRAYYLRLISKPDEYLARVSFAYPDDETRKWQASLADQERRRNAEHEAQVSPVASLESLYFDYRIESADAHIRPVRVVDDGRKTFIQMTSDAAHRELPVLVVLGPDGPEMVNYRVKGDIYIVDRLFERGALLLGVGKKSQRAEIIRGTYRGKRKLKGDPYAIVGTKLETAR